MLFDTSRQNSSNTSSYRSAVPPLPNFTSPEGGAGVPPPSQGVWRPQEGVVKARGRFKHRMRPGSGEYVWSRVCPQKGRVAGVPRIRVCPGLPVPRIPTTLVYPGPGIITGPGPVSGISGVRGYPGSGMPVASAGSAKLRCAVEPHVDYPHVLALSGL